MPAEPLALIARRIRQIGPGRILYGSDMTLGTTNPPPVTAWPTMRRKLPLSDEELRVIANNVAPYLR